MGSSDGGGPNWSQPWSDWPSRRTGRGGRYDVRCTTTRPTWSRQETKWATSIARKGYYERTRTAIAGEGVIIITDGTPAITESIGVPPQGIGSYSRVLGRYVRETPLLDLNTAIEKMTLLPARRLQDIAPVFARKGRIQVGADADITVFDPATIIDKSTYANPFQASTGVKHLLVNGTLVVRDGVFQENTFPGRKLTGLTP